MDQLTRRLRSSIEARFDRWVFCACLTLALWLVVFVPLIPYNSRHSGTAAIPGNLEQASNLYTDRAKNLISLAAGAAGAATLGAYNRWANRKVPKMAVRLLKSCWICAGLSIFSGAFGMYQFQRLMQVNLVSTSLPIVSWPAMVQLTALFAAVSFLVPFLLKAFGENASDPDL